MPADTTCYVDAGHAHDNMPVKWLSKRQKTVETSTYGSEMVAGRVAVESIIEVQYSLRILCVPIYRPTLMLGDDMSVVSNTTVSSSQLKKKQNACKYHHIREYIAANII